jgi:hypothetical protein
MRARCFAFPIVGALLLIPAGVASCGATDDARLTATPASPREPWVSPRCELGKEAECRALCSQKVWDACNNLGVMYELGVGLSTSEQGAAGMYHLACTFGSSGACSNERRVDHGAPFAEATVERARRASQEALASVPRRNDATPPSPPPAVVAPSRQWPPPAPPLEGPAAPTRREEIPAHAAQLLQCPSGQITVTGLLLGREHNPNETVFADGCGQRAVYMMRPWSSPTEWYVVSRFTLGPPPKP